MPSEVTDPDLLKQLNGSPQEVTDPAVLSQLNRPRFGTGQSLDVVGNQLVPSDSEEAAAAQSPVSGNSFLKNTQLGIGKLYTDVALGGKQLYSQGADALTGGNRYAASQQQAADKRALDAPLQATGGGKVGQFAGALPLAFVPGANTYVGAGMIGGSMGALQPTTAGESRLLNTGIGAGMGIAGKYAGDKLSGWITDRAQQPFMGWSQKTGNQAAAQAVGSEAPELTQKAIGDASKRFNRIFGAARNPDVTVPVADDTLTALEKAGAGLNSSSRKALMANDQVTDLISHLGSQPTAAQLGTISSQLGKEAAGEMAAKGGDRALGQALFAVKDHVDQIIGQSITDPALKGEYAAALPQYRTFLTLTRRPTLLNSSTGDVNLRNLGNYLQRYDTGFREGTNTSPLYQAARFGQASTIGSRPPPPILQPLKFAAYHAVNNPVVGVLGGTASRLGAPLAPLIQRGLPAAGIAGTPLLLPNLEQ
jgi:hypothetical protein